MNLLVKTDTSNSNSNSIMNQVPYVPPVGDVRLLLHHINLLTLKLVTQTELDLVIKANENEIAVLLFEWNLIKINRVVDFAIKICALRIILKFLISSNRKSAFMVLELLENLLSVVQFLALLI